MKFVIGEKPKEKTVGYFTLEKYSYDEATIMLQVGDRKVPLVGVRSTSEGLVAARWACDWPEGVVDSSSPSSRIRDFFKD